MKLVIGGYAQGKLNYALQKYQADTESVFDGELPENIENPENIEKSENIENTDNIENSGNIRILNKVEGITMSENIEAPRSIKIINHIHNYIRKRLLEGGSPDKEIFDFVDRYPDCVIICDEVGNGIVPIEAFEREYREVTGKILIELAKRADEVERVICGIGQKIK